MTNPLAEYEKYNETIVSKIYLSDACRNAFALVDTIYKGRRIKEVQAVVETEYEDYVLLGIYVKYYEDKQMSKEDELRQELQEAQNALERAQKKLKEFEEESKKYGWWKPDIDEQFYYIEDTGLIDEDTNNSSWADYATNYLNCFKTEEEAEFERLKIVINRRLQDIALRLNRGEKIDWFNFGQKKNFVEIVYLSNGVCRVDPCVTVNERRIDTAYCLDEHFASTVRKELKDDLKQYCKLIQKLEK